MMIPQRVIEGTGEEIAKYTKEHPADRFQLIILSEDKDWKPRGPGSPEWEELMAFIHSMKGQMGSLPLEATSTESLYDL